MDSIWKTLFSQFPDKSPSQKGDDGGFDLSQILAALFGPMGGPMGHAEGPWGAWLGGMAPQMNVNDLIDPMIMTPKDITQGEQISTPKGIDYGSILKAYFGSQ